MLDYFNQNSGSLTVLFSGIVAISTVVYAILTARLVSETRKMRKIQVDPLVSLEIKPRDDYFNFIDIIIRNIGSGPAYDIKFEYDNDLKLIGGDSLINLNIFRNGISFLPPKQNIQFFITSMTDNFEEMKDKKINCKIQYKSIQNNLIESDYILDFSQYVGISQIGTPPLFQISKDIEKIRTDIGHIFTGFRKLKVYTYDSKDREKEQSIREELIRRNQEERKGKNNKENV